MTTLVGTRHTITTGVRRSAILRAHLHLDGSVCAQSLIAAAVKARQEVQALEQAVNRGSVSQSKRERLVILQQRDIDHRALLTQEVPGWDDAVALARRRYPRCQRAKIMVRAARSLGLWTPAEKGAR